jgi:hypothetical protein
MSKQIDPILHKQLTALYTEIMWLARRPNVSPSMARAWYTHVVAGKFTRRIRRFTGKVSHNAVVDSMAVLRLEHHARIQTKLTHLVSAHLKQKKANPSEFIDMVLDCESVHIVTFAENYAAMKHEGDYKHAGIDLVNWRDIPERRREELWRKMLRGKVANADKFKPQGK